jgi:hypothetical protein
MPGAFPQGRIRWHIVAVNRGWRCTKGAPVWGALLILLAGPAAGRARAETRCPPPAGAEPRLGDVGGRTRLAWIDRRLSREAPRMRLWNWGWAIGIGGAGVGTLIAVPFVSQDSRIDYYTGAGAAAIGVLPFLVAPPLVIDDAHELRQRVAGGLPSADDDVCRLLSDAEQKLVRDARNEHATTAWWAHLGNLVFNTGIVLFEGLGFHHWTGGLINGVSGLAVGEAVIFTQPTQIVDDLAAYNRGDLTP